MAWEPGLDVHDWESGGDSLQDIADPQDGTAVDVLDQIEGYRDLFETPYKVS